MGKRSDTDKAIRNIMNWADRPEWLAERAAVFDAHLAPACERIGISQEELGQDIFDQGYEGMLFGVMYEDLFNRRLPPDDRNIIDDYLARRGWRESVSGRRYLQQLRDSVLSLYEVVEVSPGHHCDVRDVVRGGKTIRVHERMGTQKLVKWDKLAARVLSSNGTHIFAGGILQFHQEAAQNLLKQLAELQQLSNEERQRMIAEEVEAKLLPSANLDDQFLQSACPAFTSVWLIHTLKCLQGSLPELVNRDGDSLLFTDTRFPLIAGKSDEIVMRLDASPEWERDNPDKHSWVWLSESGAIVNKSQGGISVETLQDGQRPICATLELKPGELSLSVNSIERAERAKELLVSCLRGLIGSPLSMIQTPEQLMAEHKARKLKGDSVRTKSDTIDPDIAAEIIHNVMDQHYRQCLDNPIPILGNKTPRQCARSKKGREKVIEWLKQLENNELRRARDQGEKPYDSSWMWDELELAEYRN